MELHRKIPIAISIVIFVYIIAVLFIPEREIDTKPDIFLITAGVWLEVTTALLLFFVATTNRFAFIGLFMGFTVFLSVSLGRITGSMTDFNVVVGHNIYTAFLSSIEILAALGCVISIYTARKLNEI